MYQLIVVQIALSLTVAGYICCASPPSSVQLKNYCVFSNENRSCHSICSKCKLLEEYLSDIFAPNSSFNFYPGTHNLSRPWNIARIHDITLAAMKGGKVTIKCTSENAGLQFVNVTGLTIQGIRFFHCGMDANIDGHSEKSALIFHGGKDLQLEALNVSNSYIAGMSIHDVTGRVCIKASLFTGAYSNITGTQDKKYYAAGNFIAYNRYFEPSMVEIINTVFENNKINNCKSGDYRLSPGLSIILRISNVSVRLSNVTLRNNSGCTGGNMAIIFFDMFKLINSANITIGNNSTIEAGHGNVGGGIFIFMAKLHNSSGSSSVVSNNPVPLPLLTIRNSTISHNSADYVGGGVYLKHLETYNTSTPGIVNITGCRFVGNYLRRSGSGGLALHFTTFVAREYLNHERLQLKVFVSFCYFSDHANANSMPKVGDAVVFVKTSPYFSFSDISIVHNNCTGLLVISSNFVISSHVNISYNHAFNGGGMLLCSSAVMYLQKNTTLWITHNKVEHTGGGIGIGMECVINKPYCFFQFDSEIKQNHTLLKTIQVTVKDNTAMYAGDNIYGGYVSHCYLIDFNETAKNVYTTIFDTPNNTFYGLLNSSVSSSPTEVCLFNVTTKVKNCTYGEVEIYPGETFYITVIIVGQHSGLVPGTVYANLINSSMKRQFLPKANSVQEVKSKAPIQLHYRIYSKEENVTARLQLTVEEIEANPYSKGLVISINIKKCPTGFTLHNLSSQSCCDCHELQELKLGHYKNKINCYISSRVGIIDYNTPLWIGLVETGSRAILKSIALSTCPRDYCNLTSHIFLNLTNLTVDSGVQCYFNRIGVLCGSCMNGSSLILGSSECSEHCTNYYLFLLIVFAFAGIALVFIITFLNLTVTTGTINGLIFYANIIQIYAFYMFEENKGFVPSFLRIFIAWLNLDFGFKTCFFRGMDGFSKALLQFVFPVYIWTIAGTIIILSNRYAIAMKIFGKNRVKVLATLILFSYAKIIRAAMNALHFTQVYLPGQQHGVIHWSLDGHLKYFDGKHIPVFIIGLIFATVCLPFMVTLLCIRHIGLLSNWPFFSWIYKLKPFFDSYTGSLTDKRRFWIGLLLLARIFILGIYSFSIANSDMAVMATTVLVCFILLLIAMLFPKGVYRKHGLNVLEYFSIVNLGFLFLGLICSKYYENRASRVYIVNISIGASFLIFLLIVIYHTSLKFKCLGILKRLWLKRSRRFIESGNSMRHPPYSDEDQDREPLLVEID